jgi:ubiquinone/menaquinone biosynthesis C-methylase UbiE
MKENKYDDPRFFNQYKQMARSTGGLQAAGEWHEFQKMMPDFHSKRVLDLGCGFGWHCRYAVERGAHSVVGVDLSEKMLQEARAKTPSPRIEYVLMAIEEVEFPERTFDTVISSLALHYVMSFDEICGKINRWLVPGGDFVFSVEHPIFTISNGFAMPAAGHCIGQSIIILKRACADRSFWTKKLPNITAPSLPI